jgi:hypothetical protein
MVLPLLAGEAAIAATDVHGPGATVALLAAHAAGQGPAYVDGLRVTADLLEALLPELEPALAAVATKLAFVGRMLVVGRGPEFATAREVSLKLLETCRVAAEPLTATDLAHGPVAALDSLFPVWAIAAHDASLPTVVEAVTRARAAGRDRHRERLRRRLRCRGAQTVIPVPAHRPLCSGCSFPSPRTAAGGWALACRPRASIPTGSGRGSPRSRAGP